MKRKRPVDDEAPPPVEKPTVGQLTSHIANKQVRSGAYGKLRAEKKVRPPAVSFGVFLAVHAHCCSEPRHLSVIAERKEGQAYTEGQGRCEGDGSRGRAGAQSHPTGMHPMCSLTVRTLL